MDTLVELSIRNFTNLASKLISTGSILNEVKSHSEMMATIDGALLVLETKTKLLENELLNRIVIPSLFTV